MEKNTVMPGSRVKFCIYEVIFKLTKKQLAIYSKCGNNVLPSTIIED